MTVAATGSEGSDLPAALQALSDEIAQIEARRTTSEVRSEEIGNWVAASFAQLGRARAQLVNLRPTPSSSESLEVDRSTLELLELALALETRLARLLESGLHRGQRRRAEGWLYWVINPLLDAISGEFDVLRRGGLSYRFYNERLEFIRPISEYLDPPGGRHVLRDYRRAIGEPARRFDLHDAIVVSARDAAIAAHKALVVRAEFQDEVERRLAQFETSHPGAPNYPGGAFPRERFADLVAERVVNEVRRIAPDHTDAEFWREHGEALLASATGAEFESLAFEKRRLMICDLELSRWLEAESARLCADFDLPAAPVPRGVA